MKVEKLIFLFLSILLFAYLLARAFYIPFTHDEAATFFRFVQTSKFEPEFSREALNNHFLNTVLTWLSYSVLGHAKIALRMPNILSFAIYAFFVFKIGSFYKHTILRWLFFLTMLFTHGFIEFFAVSRGYGISMAMFLGTIYFLFKAINTNILKHHIWTSVFIAFMLSANLNTVVPAIAVLIVQMLHLLLAWSNADKQNKWIATLSIFISISSIAVVSGYLFQLVKYDAFYLVAENKGFLDSTIKTLLKLLVGSSSDIILLIIFTLTVIIITEGLRQLIFVKPNLKLNASTSIFLVLVLSVTGIFLMVLLFDINFPEDRAALYLYPLFIMSLLLIIDASTQNLYKKFRWATTPLLVFPALLLFSLNTKFVNNYKTELIPLRFYDKVVELNKKNGTLSTIGGSNMQQFAWTYINFENGGNQNMLDWTAYPDSVSYFQIIDTSSYPYSLKNYDLLDYCEISDLGLFKRKEDLKNEALFIRNFNITSSNCSKEYFSFFELKTDTLDKGFIHFDFEIEFSSKQTPFTARLVVQVVDAQNQTLNYKYFPFNWLKIGSVGETLKIHQSLLLPPLGKNAKTLKVYIWNLDNIEYYLNECRTRMSIKSPSALQPI